MQGGFARNAIRCLVVAALLAALLGSGLAPAPAQLPAAALGQPALYRLEIALLVFYGFLLLITPVYSALAWGRLPTEISTRGARFAERADRSADKIAAAVEALEHDNSLLAEGLRRTRHEIRKMAISDNTQPEVGSER